MNENKATKYMQEALVNELSRIVRLFMFFYLSGIIIVLYLFFLSETFFPINLPYSFKVVFAAFIFPSLITAVGFAIDRYRKKHWLKINLFTIIDPDAPESLFKRFDWLIVATVMFAVWSGGYFYTSYSVAGEQMHSLLLASDAKIRFIPQHVFIYLTIYELFLLPFFIVADKRVAKLVMFSYITVMVIAYIIFTFYPVAYPRPQLVANDFSTWVLSIVYNNDNPWNCFPSTHCAMAMMAGLAMLEINLGLGIMGIFVAITIGLSTLFSKQHFILDVVGGFGLALLVYYLYFKQKIIEVLDRKQKELYHRIEHSIEHRLEEIVRRVVQEELDKRLKDKGGAQGN